MSEGNAYEFKAAHIPGLLDFVVGEERVKRVSLGNNPNLRGLVMLIVEFEPCPDGGDCPTERRFIVAPTTLVIEVGEPKHIEVPDVETPTPPKLIVPRTRIVRGGEVQ